MPSNTSFLQSGVKKRKKGRGKEKLSAIGSATVPLQRTVYSPPSLSASKSDRESHHINHNHMSGCNSLLHVLILVRASC